MTDTDTGRRDLVDEVAGAMADDATDPAPAADPLHPGMTRAQLDALAKLREPLPEHLISKKPVDVDKSGQKQRCNVCHGYHAPSQHLDYAGHAAITDRLLDADPAWNWRPVTEPELLAVLPRYEGGMWIWLKVAGVERLGYGDAQGKTGHNAIKEIIGDALRNAGMRFGSGLELWHKGELHADKERAERDAAEAAERERRLGLAQSVADLAAVAERPEQVAGLAEQARVDGVDELTVRDPDGNAGALVNYLRHRYGQLADQAHAQEDGRAEAAQQAQQDEARAEQEALVAASESAAAEEAAQAHGAGGAGR